MHSRELTDEAELLIEQEKFMKSRDEQRVVRVMSSAKRTSSVPHGSRPLVTDSILPPVFTGEIKECELVETSNVGLNVFEGLGFPHTFRRSQDRTFSRDKECRKSIFAIEMEHRSKTRHGTECFFVSSSSQPPLNNPRMPSDDPIAYLKSTGPKTITGQGLGSRRREVQRIHLENIERISSMPQEAIAQERDHLFSSMSPSMISFLLHKNRSPATQTNESDQTKLESEKSSPTVDSVNWAKYPLEPNPDIPHMDQLEPEKLQWTLELPSVAKTAPDLKVSHQFEPATQSGQDTVPAAVPSQARFDLRGLVIPPEKNLDTHLGLHHHGEDPELAGYTVGELFHLARSSVPAQRHIALSTLASCLAQSRCGLHIPFLSPTFAPSLIYCLLSSEKAGDLSPDYGGGGQGGIAFLLRWCLDESVSGLTNVGSSVGNHANTTAHSGGISLSLVVDCIRGLANLLCDGYGEAFASTLYEQSDMRSFGPILLAPVMRISNKSSVECSQATGSHLTSDNDDIDHCAAMAYDPVSFLFTQSQLGQRLAWILGTELGFPGAQLPPDAAGLWLPALLIRAVRHSTEVAYRIFSTPTLFKSLLTNYLPKCYAGSHFSPDNVVGNRPSGLAHANGIPLPAVLQLFRLTLESSNSIRLSMVNDLELVERCCSYIDCSRTCDTSTVVCHALNAVVAHLPASLPLDLAVQLQIEALRFLSSCLLNNSIDDCPTPLHALNYIWNVLPSLMSSFENMLKVYESHFMDTTSINQTQVGRDDGLLISLCVAWVHFLSRAFEFLIGQSNLVTNWSINVFSKCLIEFDEQCLKLIRYIKLQFTTVRVSFERILVHLLKHGVTPVLVSSVIDSNLRVCTVHESLDQFSHKYSMQERLSLLWNDCILPIFTHQRWISLMDHFFRCSSVLTGSPQTLYDVEVTTVPILTDLAGSPCETSEKSRVHDLVKWDDIPLSTSIDQALLEPVCLVPRCLPDLGTRVFFRYQWTDDRLANFSWPSTGMLRNGDYSFTNADQNYKCVIPLVASLVSVLEHFWLRWRLHLWGTVSVEPSMPLISWIHRIASSRLFPWLKNSSSESIPHLLLALESQLLGRGTLLLSKLMDQDNALGTDIRKALCVFSKGNLIHSAALRLFSLLRDGQEVLANDLQSQLLFNPQQIELSLSQSDCQSQFSDMLSHLQGIEDVYKSLLSWPPDCITEIMNCSFHGIGSIASRPRRKSIARPLIPENWIYYPFVCYHQPSFGETDDSGIRLRALTSGLRWILFLRRTQASSISGDYATNPFILIVYLSIGCLVYSGAGSLGFGQSGILLAKLLSSIGSMPHVLTPFAKQKYSFENVPLPRSYISYYDIYVELLGQFAALSYNSPVFANLILWPCQQACHLKYRRALWGEHQNALFAIRLHLDQLLLPIQSFLEPEETDESVLRVYASALLSGGVSIERQPVLFLIAVHHLNRYFYNKQKSDSAFHLRLVRLLRSENRWLTNRSGDFHIEVSNVLRLYKQPCLMWTAANPQLLSDEQLLLGVSDPLVSAAPESHQSRLTSEKRGAFLSPFARAGLECYSDETWPLHRRTYWEKYFP